MTHLCTGTMYIPEHRWCDNCLKPSVLVGPVSILDESGVTPWGSVRACFECKNYIWTRLDGVVVDVTIQKELME
jgi:hypothetical protein